jgi:phosphoglucosamine mutase
VMSNMGLDIMAKKNGIDLVKTKVGDRYVLEEMLKNGYALGGEQSGHVIFLEKNTTGDGMISALQVLRTMKLTGMKLSELVRDIEILPQVLINARVSNMKKAAYNEDEIIYTHCIELENELEGNGRILIRPSGTEPLVRVMIEGRDIGFITERAKKLVSIIEERMN